RKPRLNSVVSNKLFRRGNSLEQMTTGKYSDMCKALHDWLEEKKINSLISIIDNMIRKFHISLEEACEVTGVSEETYKRYSLL
uniref:hypothetical protein n=1 Tax=Eubacterium ramulus TaxID=39490 RepID=UPI0022E2AE5B